MNQGSAELQELRNRIQHVESENAILLKENDLLKDELSQLRSRVAGFLKASENPPWLIAQGLVSIIIKGVLTENNSSYDVDVGQGRIRIEVKYSKLNKANSSGTLRWAWNKIFGESGNKQFDRLILIGELDRRYMNSYRPFDSDFVIFDVPYEEVSDLTISTNGRYRSIQLTSNPKTAKRSNGSRLYPKYQVNQETIGQRYRHLLPKT